MYDVVRCGPPAMIAVEVFPNITNMGDAIKLADKLNFNQGTNAWFAAPAQSVKRHKDCVVNTLVKPVPIQVYRQQPDEIAMAIAVPEEDHHRVYISYFGQYGIMNKYDKLYYGPMSEKRLKDIINENG